MDQKWECCFVEWIWDQEGIRCTMPGNQETVARGSYAQVVDLLTSLGRQGWEVATCAGAQNWLLWTLKR